MAGTSFVFMLSCLLIALFHTDVVSFLYVMLPAVCILYLVYHAYQREFFYVALGAGLGGLGMWILSRIYDGPYGAAGCSSPLPP